MQTKADIIRTLSSAACAAITFKIHHISIRRLDYARVAHKIADAIYERMTGDKGYFDTRVVYVAESGPEVGRKYRLAIMDYDGENHQFISSGNTRVLTPRFSPDRTKKKRGRIIRCGPRCRVSLG